MSEDTVPDPRSLADLQQLAAALREAPHLDAETQRSLASLLEELGSELNSSSVASAHTARLAHAVGEVARSLHLQQPSDELESARDSLKDAAARAEVEAPVATGLVYRFLDLLGSIGI